MDAALVPIENSLEGSVDVTLDTLAIDAPDVEIVGERVSEIRNCLIAAGNSGDKNLRGPVQTLSHDPSPIIAEAAQWALRELA